VLPLYGNTILRFNGTTDILFIFNFRKMVDHLRLQRARLHNIESSDGSVRITRLAIPGRWANDFYRCPHCGRGPILKFPSEAFPNLKECFVCEDIHNSDEEENNDRRRTFLESEVRASVRNPRHNLQCAAVSINAKCGSMARREVRMSILLPLRVEGASMMGNSGVFCKHM
jgi:hypothetical protein